MSNPSFQEQLHELWRTRPVRLPRQGPIAGVAAGIGHRYRVDPVLVRVAFAVSTIFGGVGIVLYLAGWLLLPQAGDQTSAAESLVGRGHSSESGTKTVVLAVALIIALSTLGPVGVGLGGSGLISLALMLGGLWLLYQRTPVPPALPADIYPPTGYAGAMFPPTTFPATTFPASAPYSVGPYTTLPQTYEPSTPPTAPTPEQAAAAAAEPAASPAPAPSDTATTTGPGTGAATATGTATGGVTSDVPQPPAWDPLGVAPFAWDLPEPTPPAPPTLPKPPKSRLTTTVLGLAIIAAAATWAVSSATGSEWLSPARIGAVALAVIGVGMLIGAFLRRGYGLLVVTGPLIGFVLLASLIGPVDWDGKNMGDIKWTPTAADLQPEYSGQFGDFTLDLTGVELTGDKTVDVEMNAGSMTVLVPQNMDVKNNCSIAFGETNCLPEGIDGGANGVGGPVLTLNMDGTFGEMRVDRG
ncbi:PspC domain-containing protein [Rhodococcus maanshanensis]|uniref:Phage shock protein PspC (Stress-responsive transcriptional regulator) n=1 Tax=Rhodococcus maanshanensis TaxID=183556 RepID=A0A1H7KHC8_9NOCA|nr:PspC domain-containing protein [Rhodococcus maanshanensis]SEK85934.1 Phage shock protein PspC (stress-responsive transcriptional regulator) [Rhodococcus maanshanensis]